MSANGLRQVSSAGQNEIFDPHSQDDKSASSIDENDSTDQIRAVSSDVWATIEINADWSEDNNLPKSQFVTNYPGQKDNEVRTTRYRWYTFIPLTLLEQYRVLSNIYYIFVLIVSFLPMSPLSYFFQLIPMLIVLIVSMIKSGVEDLMKHFEDKKRNSAPVLSYDRKSGQFKEVHAQDLHVGDILKIDQDMMVPSDCLFVGSSQESSLCYFSETNLNGETAVKTMQPHPTFGASEFVGNIDQIVNHITSTEYYVDVPEPDRDLTRFDARLKKGDEFWPITIHNVLLRGTATHYTDNVICVVLRTGHDTKVMKNIKMPPAKLTKFDKNLNRILIIVFILKMILCLISTFVGVEGDKGKQFPLIKPLYESYGMSWLEYFTQYFVLYSYLFPISLTVTIEIIRLFHKIIISYDSLLIDAEFGHATAHNSNIIGQLGLVTHILSDKTGTLTENQMELLKFSTKKGGNFNAGDFLNSIEADKTLIQSNLDFLLAMAICNNVIVHKKNDGTIEYNADSPDEAAFVSYAALSGVKLIARGLTSLTVEYNGQMLHYEILAQLPFNSDRKRMSIIVRKKKNLDLSEQVDQRANQLLDGTDNEENNQEIQYDNAIIYTKGADNIMSERTKDFTADEENIVNDFAALGLRTLVFASRDLENSELDDWLNKYREAEASLQNRDELVFQCAAQVEDELHYIGISGVEDRLQSEVPQTIEWIRKAGIKLWVLTGDKLETAVAIGKTSGVITPTSEMLIVSTTYENEIQKKLDVLLDNLQNGPDQFENPVLIMTAASLELAMTNYMEKFVKLAEQCHSVILCRVSPFMKAHVTQIVKENIKKAQTLAVGDGANDVGMIQVADIGIGIYGREGSQAAMSSDIAIPRFKHLRRMLMVHGHWTYRRFGHVAIIMIYKNFVFIFAQLWFSFYTLWTPTSFYSGFIMSCFNLVFTALPPFIFGFWEQDLKQDVLENNPHLYHVEYDPMSVCYLIFYIVLGLYQSLCGYFASVIFTPDFALTEIGLQTYMIVVYTVVGQIILWMNFHNVWTTALFLVNIILAPIIIVIYCYFISGNLADFVNHAMDTTVFWMTFIVGVICGLLPSFIIDYTRKRFFPTPVRILQEQSESISRKVSPVRNWINNEEKSIREDPSKNSPIQPKESEEISHSE